MKRPRLVKLPIPAGDGDMAETLLWLLTYVRSGQVKGFSICVLVESEADGMVVLGHASANDDELNEMALLGAMRSAEHELFDRRRERDEGEG